MGFGEVARGLADLAAYVLSGPSDTIGTKVDLPGARSLTWTVSSDSDQLGGDDAIVAIARSSKSLTGSLELALTSLAGFAALSGGTAATSGVTPNQVITLDEASGTPSRYLQIAGQANSNDSSGSAYRVTLLKIMITSGGSETLGLDAWNTPTFDFEGVAKGGILLTRKSYETLVALA